MSESTETFSTELGTDAQAEFVFRTGLRRGKDHKDFCEDALATAQIGEYFIAAVFDGCSTGVESHFASSLMKKIFHKSLSMFSWLEESSPETREVSKDFLYRMFLELSACRTFLQLDKDTELLSTIVFLVYNKGEQEATITFIGDGYASVNGEGFEVDQDNTPQYMSYYLDSIHDAVTFDKWFDTLPKYDVKDAYDISICTDGILSFRADLKLFEGSRDIDPIEYLTVDRNLIRNKACYGRKLNILRKNFNQVHLDDFSIVRVIYDVI